MEAVLPIVQAYGVWIVLGGVFLFLITRSGGGMSCCGGSMQGGSCGSQQMTPKETDAAGDAAKPASVSDLRARLAELRAEQERLARRIAALEGDAAGVAAAERENVGASHGGGWNPSLDGR